MGANERLQLSVEAKAVGTAEIERLATALNKVVDISSKRGGGGDAAPAKTGFESFPDQIKQLVQDPLGAAESSITSFASSFGPVGAAIGGTIATFGALAGASVAAARSLAAIGVEYQNVSLRTGLTTKEVALFGYAAQSTGQDIGIFETAMRKLSAGLADAGGAGKKTRDALDELGVKTRDLHGNIAPTSDIFKQISAGLNAMTEPARRDALAIELLGRAGIVALPSIMKLNDELERGEKLNFAPSDDEIKKFQHYNQELTDIGVLWDKVKRDFKQGIVGEITLKLLKSIVGGVGGLVGKPEEGTFDHFWDVPGMSGAGLAPGGAADYIRNLSGIDPTKGPTEAPIHFKGAPFGLGPAKGQYYSDPLGDMSRGTAAGKAKYQPQLDSYANNSLPGLEASLSEAKEKADTARIDLASAIKSNSTGPDIDRLGKAWNKATGDVERYTNAIKAVNEGDSLRKHFADLGNALAGFEQDDPSKQVIAKYNAGIAELKTKTSVMSPKDRADAFTELNTGKFEGLANAGKKAAQELIKEFAMVKIENDKIAVTWGEETFKKFQEGLKDAEAGLTTNPLYKMIFDQSDITQHGPATQRSSEDLIKDAQAQSQQRQRLIETTALPGNEVETQQKLSDIKVDQAERDLAFQKDLAERKRIDAQAEFDAEVTYERTLRDIKSDNANKLAELRKTQLDNEVSAVTGLLHAALGGGKGVQSYLKDLGVNTGETVLKNVLTSGFNGTGANSGTTGMLDKFFPHFAEGTTLGNVFKGTLGGPNANKSSISQVTMATTSDAAKMALNGTGPTAIFQTSTTVFQAAVNQFGTTIASMSGGTISSSGQITPGSSSVLLPGMIGVSGNISSGTGSGYGFGSLGSGEGGIEGYGIPGSPDNSSGESSGAGSLAQLAKSAKSFSGLAGIQGGLAHTGDVQGIFTGVSSGPNGAESLSTSERIGAGIGTAGVIAGGAIAAYNGFSKGGVQGNLQGVGAVAGTAAALDPEPISKMVLASVALVTGLAASIIGDPKQLRQESINKTIGNAKYEAPTAINESLGVNGGYSDVDAFGNVRSSNLSPNPTGVTDPTQWYRAGVYNPIPGSTGTPYGAPMQSQQAPQMTVHIAGDVIDPQSFFDRNGAALASTMTNQFGTNTGLAVAATKATVGG